MLRSLYFAIFSLFISFSIPPVSAADEFTMRNWSQIQAQAKRGNALARGLREGYLSGIRDTLRFYSKLSKEFPICWPKDHEVDIGLVNDTVNAVRKGHPEIAKPEDNFAYIVVLALYEAYPCR